MRKRRTFWHLESLGRRPTDYEITSTRLTFAPAPGASVDVPMAAFYRVHGPDARLVVPDWERFADPAATTYARYVERQRDREVVVQTLLDGLDASGYDKGLPPDHRHRLGVTLSALRFPAHALQMLAAYLGRLSPSSPMVIAFSFQAADELRRVQRFAYRLRQLVDHEPALPDLGRAAWQSGAEWQPLRRTLEELLATRDWLESWVATALLLKPVFDELVLVRWPRVAAGAGDALLPLIAASLFEDCRWHQELARALLRLVVAASPGNVEAIAGAMTRWRPAVDDALATLASALVGPDAPPLAGSRDDALQSILGGTP